MIPNSTTLTLAAANAANIVGSNTPGAAGALPLVTSPWVADAPRRVLVTYGSEASARTLVITGTNRSGAVISETLTTAVTTPGTAYTQQDFATVTSATVAAAWSAAMTVGTNGVGSSAWIIPSFFLTPINIGIAVTLVSGSATYTVEYTYQDPNKTPTVVPTVWPFSALSAKSASTDGVPGIVSPIGAYRVTVTAGTGVIRMDSVQAGNRQ